MLLVFPNAATLHRSFAVGDRAKATSSVELSSPAFRVYLAPAFGHREWSLSDGRQVWPTDRPSYRAVVPPATARAGNLPHKVRNWLSEVHPYRSVQEPFRHTLPA